MPSSSRSFLFSLVCGGALLLSGCGSTKQLESQPPPRALTIDGQIDDWGGAVRRVDDKAFSLGVLNDGQYLYVALVSRDQGITGQILRGGLALWLDPAGGKAKEFGIRFPLGMMAGRPGGGAPGGAAPGGLPRDPEALRERFLASLYELEILRGEEEGTQRVQADGLPGLSAKATFDYGTLIYELKVPLQQSDIFRFAVGAAPGTTIGLGLETPEREREAFREDDDDIGGRDSRGGRGGIGGIGRDGSRDAGRPGRLPNTDALKLWTTVTLAR